MDLEIGFSRGERPEKGICLMDWDWLLVVLDGEQSLGVMERYISDPFILESSTPLQPLVLAMC